MRIENTLSRQCRSSLY